jgi:hypothetical protein
MGLFQSKLKPLSVVYNEFNKLFNTLLLFPDNSFGLQFSKIFFFLSGNTCRLECSAKKERFLQDHVPLRNGCWLCCVL